MAEPVKFTDEEIKELQEIQNKYLSKEFVESEKCYTVKWMKALKL